MDEIDGCFNPSADLVDRVNETWSDTNLSNDFTVYANRGETFNRLQCRQCGSVDRFEVLQTDDYETSAKCCACGMYYIVHSG